MIKRVMNAVGGLERWGAGRTHRIFTLPRLSHVTPHLDQKYWEQIQFQPQYEDPLSQPGL